MRAAVASLLLAALARAADPIEIGPGGFVREERPEVIRSGEISYARVPPDLWAHRLALARSAGLDTVSTYVVWAHHETSPGRFDWTGPRDVGAFCREAARLGLRVIVRPGPYVCGEWDLGGYPWWLLRDARPGDRFLRTADPRHLRAAERWMEAVGRELGPLAATRGGPIILAQVENEHAAYGREPGYVGALAAALRRGGLDVPMFELETPARVRPSDAGLFAGVALGSDPAGGLGELRKAMPDNPAWVAEFYPGWFDTWGKPHSRGQRDRFLGDLRWMVDNGVSFNLYAFHGGTSFGPRAGANSPPFAPQATSYDLDAPVDEQGRPRELFHAIRSILAARLPAGETLPEPPPPVPTQRVARVAVTASAAVLANLPRPAILPPGARLNFEANGLGHGIGVYSCTIPAGPADILRLRGVADFAWVFVEGRLVGKVDRRVGDTPVGLPARERPARLDVIVEEMGRVNFGPGLHDLKGIQRADLESAGGARRRIQDWVFHAIPTDTPPPAGLRWENREARGPAWWGATFRAEAGKDTWLDLRGWGKGLAWVNGRPLGRFWSIGPTQTLHLPGCWIREGANELVLLDLEGPEDPYVAGLDQPILDELRSPHLPRANRRPGQEVRLPAAAAASFRLEAGKEWQTVRLEPAARGRHLALEIHAAQDGQRYGSLAELELLGADGTPLPRQAWRLSHASSEERVAENGLADNILDGKPETYWHSRWRGEATPPPHILVIDLGASVEIGAVRLLPRPDMANGRIRDARVHLSELPFPDR
jgi:beta-galactosidase